MSLGGVGLVFEIFCLPMLLVEPTLAFELDDGTFFFLASFSSSLKTSNISFGDSSNLFGSWIDYPIKSTLTLGSVKAYF